jgi:hypothetical protein
VKILDASITIPEQHSISCYFGYTPITPEGYGVEANYRWGVPVNRNIRFDIPNPIKAKSVIIGFNADARLVEYGLFFSYSLVLEVLD